jgi:excisionase family DNA binding protein
MNEQNEATTSDLLSFDEAIKFLDTSKSTLYRLLSQDEIRGVKVGKQWRFRKSDLTAYIERSPVAVSVDVSARADLETESEFFAGEILDAGEIPKSAESSSPEAKIVELADRILQSATIEGASDIHIEPGENSLRLRFRIDGVLHEIRRIPMNLHDSVTTRFKEMAEMNLIEKRLPQDGRFRIQNDEKEYELRMSILPTLYGESIVMRILDRNATLPGLDRLGIEAHQVDFIRACMNRPSGVVLVTGPTGSGKTTFLYSCLLEIDASGAKVLTVEDPIEMRFPDIVQVQVNARNGLTFAAAMRSIQRQDPDVILCGELRDRETVQLALQTAITGHVVLSALHADDCLGAISRFVDIGIERFLITSSLNAIVATRRSRKLCPHCKSVADASLLAAKVIPVAERGGYRGPKDAVFFVPKGCEHCRGTGFQGRINFYEVLPAIPNSLPDLFQPSRARRCCRSPSRRA